MPSGAKKRKAAKKKQVHNPSTTNHNQAGEKDGGELSSPTSQDPSIVVEKRDDVLSDNNKSKDANEIEIRSKSKNSSSSSSSDSSDDESNVVEQVVVLESAPVESVPVVESLPETITPVVESLPETITPVVDPVKPVDSLLEEVSKVFDEITNEEKKELVVEETPVVVDEQTVVSEIDVKDDLPTSSVVVESVLNENEVANLPVSVEKPSYVDCVNEADTVEHEQSDKQANVGSTPSLVQKTTSWKSCCGIFELFSGSQRN